MPVPEYSQQQNVKQSARRRPLILAATVAIVVAAAAIASRLNEWQQPSIGDQQQNVEEDSFETCLTTMLEAAQSGDVDEYLSCFGGPLRDRLAAQIKQSSGGRASDHLKSREVDLKNYVIKDRKKLSKDLATIVLERTYSDRNQIHRLRLERSGDRWRIVEMTAIESFAPEIPYGTPVAPGVGEEPEQPPTSEPGN